MTAKEKAEDLKEKFSIKMPGVGNVFMQRFALLAVDEIIDTLNSDIKDLDVRGNVLLDLIEYWREVKQEIENLK